MNLRCIIVLLLLLSIRSEAQFYSQSIYCDSYDNKDLISGLNDLQRCLSKLTGKDFKIYPSDANSKKGIFLQLNKPGLLPKFLFEKLNSGTEEDFVLSGSNYSLNIVATHPLGLIRGIYTYLDLLGVKWYLPGDEWIYLPNAKEIVYKETSYHSPSFVSRDFFGTGGIRDVRIIDTNAKIKKEWEDWKRRNRMGGSVVINGHYGEWFNVQHRAELEKHPEYLAMINGKRVPWNESDKWCISNQKFRELFINDRLTELKNRLASRRYPTEKIVLTVEPSDGGSECECDQCKKMGTVSDRVFFLANETAKAFAKIDPLAFVSLYAYNTHSAPPSFSLEPNVIVQIIPYAFQNFGTPEQMIAAWKLRNKELFVYDYYNIPDWQWDVPLPRKTSYDTLIKRIEFWKQQGVKGFLLESTYGTCSAGLGLYLMARLGWDDKTNVATVKKEFFDNMFGKASQQVSTLFEYLNNRFKGPADLPYLLHLMKEAAGKTETLNAQRIACWQAYLHYLLLYYQWQVAPDQLKQSATASLLRFIWEIYPLKVIHSTRIADLIYYQWKTNDPLILDWNFVEPYGKELKKINFLTTAAISSIAAIDEKSNPIPEDFIYENAKPFLYTSHLSPSVEVEPMLMKEFPETYIRGSANREFDFSIRLKDEPSIKNFVSDIVISCVDTSSRQVIYYNRLSVGTDWKKIKLNLPTGKTYKLNLQFTPWIYFKFDKSQWLGFSTIPTYADLHKLWFYVRNDTKYIYYTNAILNQPSFIDPEGKKVEPEKVNDFNMYRINVQNGAGKWWSISDAQYRSLQFFSKPDLFFVHSDYTVQPVSK